MKFNFKRELQEASRRGALCERIMPLEFLDREDAVILTKRGDVFLVVAVKPVDTECLAESVIDSMHAQLEHGFRLFGPEYRVYQILVHEKHSLPQDKPTGRGALDRMLERRAAILAGLYGVSLYYVFLATAKGMKPNASFSPNKQIAIVQAQVEALAAELISASDAFCSQVRSFLECRRTGKEESFRILRSLLNFDELKRAQRLSGIRNLHWQLGDSQVDAWGDHLRVDDEYVRILTLKNPPSVKRERSEDEAVNSMRPGMLNGLTEIRGNFIAVSEWRMVTETEATKIVDLRKAHFRRTKTSLAAQATGGGQSKDIVDEGKQWSVGELGLAQKRLAQGHLIGKYALTIIVHDETLEGMNATSSAVSTLFNGLNSSVYGERWNQHWAFWSAVPGGYPFQRRYMNIFDDNHTALALWQAPATGTPQSDHLRRECLMILETRQKTPYFYNLHYKALGHGLQVGVSDSGKSFFLNALIAHAARYRPRVTILDMGGSFEHVTAMLDGTYLKLGIADRNFKINPFACELTEDNANFLSLFVKLLAEQSGPPITAGQEREIFESVTNLSVLAPKLRTLWSLSRLLTRELQERLKDWTNSGRWGWLFDNEEDNVSLADVQCIEFGGLRNFPQAMEPLILLLLHRVSEATKDVKQTERLKVVVIDELWLFLRNSRVQAFILEWLKTYRKHNGAVILSTQSPGEIDKSDIMGDILEECATKLFFANPGLNRDQYVKDFHLSAAEISKILGIREKGEFLMKRPDGSKLLRLRVDEESYWLFSNSPWENARRRDAKEAYGNKWLEAIAGRNV